MGRPLTGTIERTVAGSFRVVLPAERGSKKRVKATFPTVDAAMAYRTTALEALTRGDALPAKDLFMPVAGEVSFGHAGLPETAGSAFGSVAWHWHSEYYREARRAGPDRAFEVGRLIDGHVLPYMDALGVVDGSALTREQFKQFLLRYSAPQSPPPPLGWVRPGQPGERWFTVREVIGRSGRSKSTVKRYLRSGKFARARRVAGIWEIPEGDVVDAGLLLPEAGRKGRRAAEGYSQGMVDDLRRVLTAVLIHGRDVAGWILSFDPEAVPAVRTRKPPTPDKAPLLIKEAAQIAQHLHPVHQSALWLCRILGLRISEAYGIRLCDVVDLGDRGVVYIRQQGGRKFRTDDPAVSADSRSTLKTASSYRVLVAPRQVMELVRVLVAAFHPGEDWGSAESARRLLPGLSVAGESGQQAFRTALARAAQRCDLAWSKSDVRLTPHDLRKAVITDLTWETDLSPEARKRFAGHVPGDDIHSRTYVLDHPSWKPMREAAEALERLLEVELPEGLMVPTITPCTTGVQPALAATAAHIDTTLAASGWLVEAHDVAGDALLTTGEAAEVLNVSPGTVRRWLNEGVLNGVRTETNLNGWAVKAVEAERLAAQVAGRMTVDRLAEELGEDYHGVYSWIARRNLPLDRTARPVVVPPETERALRARRPLPERWQ